MNTKNYLIVDKFEFCLKERKNEGILLLFHFKYMKINGIKNAREDL